MRMLVVMLAGLGLTAAAPLSERTGDTWQSLPGELAVEFHAPRPDSS